MHASTTPITHTRCIDGETRDCTRKRSAPLRERKEKSETLSQSLIVRMTQRTGGGGRGAGQRWAILRGRARESSFLSLKEISMSSRHYASQGRGGGGEVALYFVLPRRQWRAGMLPLSVSARGCSVISLGGLSGSRARGESRGGVKGGRLSRRGSVLCAPSPPLSRLCRSLARQSPESRVTAPRLEKFQ